MKEAAASRFRTLHRTTVVADVAVAQAEATIVADAANFARSGCGRSLFPLSMVTTNEVWNEFSASVLDYFQSKVKDRHVAEDLRQDVFIKIHKHMDEVRQREKLSHWISVVMRNTLVDYWKTKTDKPLEKLPSLKADAEQTHEEHLAERCVRNMIRQIPEKYAAPLALSDLEGVKQKEVAEQLNLSLSGAKSRIQRGREMLKDAIQSCCKVELNERNEIVDYECRMEGCQ